MQYDAHLPQKLQQRITPSIHNRLTMSHTCLCAIHRVLWDSVTRGQSSEGEEHSYSIMCASPKAEYLTAVTQEGQLHL